MKFSRVLLSFFHGPAGMRHCKMVVDLDAPVKAGISLRFF
jgi:hypothetical protein